MSNNDTLGYDVFVSEPIPLNVAGLLPNGERHMFSPLATTLIYGESDAVLVDPPLTSDQATAVGGWVDASGKKVTHIFVTHGHGDHWFTAGVLAERFGAQVVASAGTIEQMRPCAIIASPSRVMTSSSSRSATPTPTKVAYSTCPISASSWPAT
jgi:glyoxylase-like metal-dependent hydrolase (beta-lactamase superfamily II)